MNAEKMHTNYILVLWEQEENAWTVAVRNYKTKAQSVEKIEDFIERIVSEIKNRSL
jgi:threonyl-tRNA synthetase